MGPGKEYHGPAGPVVQEGWVKRIDRTKGQLSKGRAWVVNGQDIQSLGAWDHLRHVISSAGTITTTVVQDASLPSLPCLLTSLDQEAPE